MTDAAQRRVLIVEDSYYLATDAARALRKEQMDVLKMCSSSEHAFAVLAEERPDCAILDINLGDGVCFDLADRLRERSIPFLFYTGYDRNLIPDRFADVICLRKPVNAQQLVAAIAQLSRSA